MIVSSKVWINLTISKFPRAQAIWNIFKEYWFEARFSEIQGYPSGHLYFFDKRFLKIQHFPLKFQEMRYLSYLKSHLLSLLL